MSTASYTSLQGLLPTLLSSPTILSSPTMLSSPTLLCSPTMLRSPTTMAFSSPTSPSPIYAKRLCCRPTRWICQITAQNSDIDLVFDSRVCDSRKPQLRSSMVFKLPRLVQGLEGRVRWPLEYKSTINANAELSLGDIIIAVDSAARQAEERGHRLLGEIHNLLVHGLINVLGYDKELGQAAYADMENKKAQILSRLGWKGKQLISSSCQGFAKDGPGGRDQLNFADIVCRMAFSSPRSGSLRLRRNPTSWVAPSQRLRRCRSGVAVHALGTKNEQVAQEGVRFRYFSGSARKLLTELMEIVDKELGPHLTSSQTPSDVRYFKNLEETAEGSVILRAGLDSKVDFVLESWIHANLPFGILDIGTIVIMLGSDTDCPHFLFEFILTSSTLVIVLDHLPRKDLVLDSAYLKRYYEETELDKVRQTLEKDTDAKPYISPVLFIRSVVSPTSIVYKLNDNSEAQGCGLDQQIGDVVYPAATKMLRLWVDSFESTAVVVESMDDLLKRDKAIKEKGVEVDLSSSLPRIFGQEITNRVVAAFRSGV